MPKRDGTKKALVRTVKKAVKKSQRRLDAEKFEKELTRTITFLENLQRKLASLPSPKAAGNKEGRKPAARNASKKPARKAAAKRPAPAKVAVTAASQTPRATSAMKKK